MIDLNELACLSCSDATGMLHGSSVESWDSKSGFDFVFSDLFRVLDKLKSIEKHVKIIP